MTVEAAPKPQEKEPDSISEEPILEISVLAPKRPHITFEDKKGKIAPYELAIMNDFGIEEQQQLTKEGAEFDQLWAATRDLSETDKLRLKTLLDAMFEKVLRAPKTIKSQFNDNQRSQVVMAFTLAPLAAAAARARQQAMERVEAEQEEESPTTEN